MDQASAKRASHEQQAPGATADPASGRAPCQEPKLAFIEPKLAHMGDWKR
jgi:hypothetical protein